MASGKNCRRVWKSSETNSPSRSRRTISTAKRWVPTVVLAVPDFHRRQVLSPAVLEPPPRLPSPRMSEHADPSAAATSPSSSPMSGVGPKTAPDPRRRHVPRCPRPRIRFRTSSNPSGWPLHTLRRSRRTGAPSNRGCARTSVQRRNGAARTSGRLRPVTRPRRQTIRRHMGRRRRIFLTATPTGEAGPERPAKCRRLGRLARLDGSCTRPRRDGV
jgi:hypothetical protein